MFGKRKEDLVKAKELADKNLQDLLTEEKKQQDLETKLKNEKEAKIRWEAKRRATYFLDVEPQLRILYLVQYIAQNPQLTTTVVNENGASLIKRITIEELIKAFELEDFLNSLVK